MVPATEPPPGAIPSVTAMFNQLFTGLRAFGSAWRGLAGAQCKSIMKLEDRGRELARKFCERIAIRNAWNVATGLRQSGIEPHRSVTSATFGSVAEKLTGKLSPSIHQENSR